MGGYIAGSNDSNIINNPVFPFSNTSPFNVYDTNYNASLYVTYNDGGSRNTNIQTVTGRTELPSNRRSNWEGTFNITGPTYPNFGYIDGIGAVRVYIQGTASNTFNRSFISINSNPGNINGCNFNISISDQSGLYSNIFSNSGYTYTNTNKSNITLGPGNRSGTISIYDAVSGIVTPARSNDTGFWMAFDLDYKYRYNTSAVGIPTTISLNGTQITNTAYVDSDPGQISIGTFIPDYTVQPGDFSVNNNLIGSTAISVRSFKGTNSLPITNIFENIRPFNFGRMTLSYRGVDNSIISDTTFYDWSPITGRNIMLPITLLPSIPINTITTYNMDVSFSNIKSNASSNISNVIFNDNTFTSANQVITATNAGFTNATPKWILGAWRTDMDGLSFSLNELRATHGNSTFNIGPGFINWSNAVLNRRPNISFSIISGTTNFTSIIADYPRGVTGGYGTFDCLRAPDEDINSLTTSGGCLISRINNVFSIFCPYQYTGGRVNITIFLGGNQHISNIIYNS